jgi:hypothetical protein
MRRKLDAHPREIENCRNLPNLMVVRHYGLEVESIEQLTLLTLAPPHHRNSPSMAASPRRNHGSLGSSRQFCNKIGQAADPACPLDVRSLGVKRTRYAPPEFFRA